MENITKQHLEGLYSFELVHSHSSETGIRSKNGLLDREVVKPNQAEAPQLVAGLVEGDRALIDLKEGSEIRLQKQLQKEHADRILKRVLKSCTLTFEMI